MTAPATATSTRTQGSRTARRPNVLWLCTDQQRYDMIAALGNGHIATPNLDRLVRGGTAFTRAYCQSPICTPSRASFMSGLYPSTVHVNYNGNDRFPDGVPVISRLFADAGYRCGLAGKLHLASAEHRVEKRADDGYSFWRYSHSPHWGVTDGNDYAPLGRRSGRGSGRAPERFARLPVAGSPLDVVHGDGAGVPGRAGGRALVPDRQLLLPAPAIQSAARIPRPVRSGRHAGAAVPGHRPGAAGEVGRGLLPARGAPFFRARYRHPQGHAARLPWRTPGRRRRQGPLLRADHPSRRADRAAARTSRAIRAARRHDRPVHVRPRRNARRPRAAIQGLPLLRRAGAGAADLELAGHHPA